MKNVYTLILALLASITLYAQDDDNIGLLDRKKSNNLYAGLSAKPEKGDAQIVVNSPYSLLEISQHLMDNGYSIEKVDTVLNYVKTEPRSMPANLNGEFYLNIMKKGHQYKVVGMYRFNFTASLAGVSPAKGAYDMGKYSKGMNPSRRIFDVAYNFAKSFGEIVDIMP